LADRLGPRPGFVHGQTSRCGSPLPRIHALRGISASLHVIASIEAPAVIEKILTHIERRDAVDATPHAPRAPPATSGGDPQALKVLEPYIGDLHLQQVHSGTLARYIRERSRKARPGTIRRDLTVVRRILNLAARSWRDEQGSSWLETAPLIQMPVDDNPRQPYPLSWEEQDRLITELPRHLAEMALFKVNTGTREREVCGLRWEWEHQFPELGASVFVIPAAYVKNKQDRLVVLNDIARQVVDSRRGTHETHVYGYRGHPVTRMLNSGWKRARAKAGLPTLRVHDLKHTFGRRLRAAGVSFEDRQDLLGHKSGRITTHYSAAEISSLIDAAHKITRSRKTPALTILLLPGSAQVLEMIGGDGWT